MPVRIADSMKQMNDLNSFPVAYGSDIWLDKNKGSGTPNYDSIQNMLNNDELGGGSAIQVDTLPIASEDEFGRIYQYTGDSGTYQNGFFYRCDYVDNEYVWTEIVYGSNLQAGDGIDITDDTISVKDRLEEVDELPTPTAELLDEKKCYLLRSEQTGFVRGSVYHIGGSEEQLVNGTSVVRVGEGGLDDYVEYFDTTGSHSDYNKKYTPKSNVVVLCKNFSPLTPYKEVAYFIAESQALRVHYADGSNDETFNYNSEKLYIKALVDLAWIPSGANLDFDSDNFDVADDTVSLKDGYKKIFTGTHAKWEELTLEEKKSYDEADFTDDIASGFPVISDVVAEGDENPVTSSAVYDKIHGAIGDIKCNVARVPCADYSNNMDLSSYCNASLDSGYEFLCYIHVASNGWIFPVEMGTMYIASPNTKNGAPYVKVPTQVPQTNYIDFYYLEIKRI